MRKIACEQDIIFNEKFDEVVSALVGTPDGQKDRYVSLYKKHIENFSKNEGYFFSSPGRIEVIGNHTDHNNGKVMCASVTVDTLAFVTPRDDGKVVVMSKGFPAVEADIAELDIVDGEKGTSKALVKGLIRYYIDNGYKVGGFSASTVSNVPPAAGVSSSAAFELLIAEILNVLYNDGKIGKVKKAQASQYAENVYFMKPCGLLDQSAISLGGVSMIDFEDTQNPYILTVDWPFSDVDIIITNTGGSHADLTADYASIRQEMESVAKYFNKLHLRDVDEDDFYNALPTLQNEVNGRAILRAIHFFDENNRVDKALSSVQIKNEEGFCDAINKSGDSSYKLLQNCYVSSDTAERIPLGLAITSHAEGVRAYRVHGGGFAGTMIAYVDKKDSAEYIEKMKSVFGENSVYKMGIRKSGACYVEL